MVLIKYHGEVQKYTEIKSEELDVKTVKELIKYINDVHGIEARNMTLRSHILINNVSATNRRGLFSRLHEGDVVKILPVCGGG